MNDTPYIITTFITHNDVERSPDKLIPIFTFSFSFLKIIERHDKETLIKSYIMNILL